jgi:hypothetical protein
VRRSVAAMRGDLERIEPRAQGRHYLEIGREWPGPEVEQIRALDGLGGDGLAVDLDFADVGGALRRHVGEVVEDPNAEYERRLAVDDLYRVVVVGLRQPGHQDAGRRGPPTSVSVRSRLHPQEGARPEGRADLGPAGGIGRERLQGEVRVDEHVVDAGRQGEAVQAIGRRRLQIGDMAGKSSPCVCQHGKTIPDLARLLKKGLAVALPEVADKGFEPLVSTLWAAKLP